MKIKSLISIVVTVLLVLPFMCLNTVAEDAATIDEGSQSKVFVDPETGYSIVETEKYTAVLPKGGLVVCSDSEESPSGTSEMLEETTYPCDPYIVEFDRSATEAEMYEHLTSVHPELTEDAAHRIAIQLTDNIEKAREASLAGNTKNGRTIINLGRIVDGELVMDEIKGPPYDQYTSIISEGWSVTPHLESHQLWCNYRQAWEGLDLYKSSDGGSYTFNHEVSVSVNVGYNASGGLSVYDAISFGLEVNASQTVISKISVGYTLNVSAWKKHMVRPYIYSYDDKYSGVYRYYCYNAYENSYLYDYEPRESINKYEVEHSIRAWVRENTAHNPNLPSPIPPTNWEW